MSADHLQHIHVRTLINTNGKWTSLKEPVAHRAAEQDVLSIYCVNISTCQCGVKVLPCSRQLLNTVVYSIWARHNLQSKQWIINKMSYWLIDLYARQSGFLPPHTHHFNLSHNNSPDCDSRISRSISDFSLHLWTSSWVCLHNLRLRRAADCFCYGSDSHNVSEDGFIKKGFTPLPQIINLCFTLSITDSTFITQRFC